MPVDPIKEMLTRTDKLDNPDILKEDTPPSLRFIRGTLEDRMKTEETGMYGYKDAIFVHVRALGDIRTEVPYVVETTVQVPSFETVLVSKPVPVIIQDTDGNEHTEHRQQEVPEERATYTEETVTPWLDQVDERLRKGIIGQAYRDYCHKAYAQWKEKGDIPIDGTPIVDWRMISPAQKETLLDMDINTIEKVAEMTEDALEQFGMNGQAVKKKAQEYMSIDRDKEKTTADIVKLKTDAKEQKADNKNLKQKIADLEAMLEDKTKPE